MKRGTLTPSRLYRVRTVGWLKCVHLVIKKGRVITSEGIELPHGKIVNSLEEGVVSKETVVLRRWGSSIQKFGFINGVDNVNWPPYRDSKS